MREPNLRHTAGLAVLALLIAGCMHTADVAGQNDAVLALVSARSPGVVWDRGSIVRGDFDCDGQTDLAISGTTAEAFHVAIAFGPVDASSSIADAQFRFEGGDQDDLCGRPAVMELDELDDPTEDLGEIPEGYRVSGACRGLRITSGECDAFHLFWNHATRTIDWWRL